MKLKANDQLIIRKFKTADILFVSKFWMGTDRLEGVFQNDSVDKILKRFSMWGSEKDEKGNAYIGFAIELNDRLIGLSWFTENIKGQLTFSMYLDVDYRGKGYGVEAYKIIEPLLIERGFNLIKSSCRQNNIASFKMHEKCGFDLIKSELSPNGTPMYRWQKLINKK